MPTIDLKERPNEEQIDLIVDATTEEGEELLSPEDKEVLREGMVKDSEDFQETLSLFGSRLEQDFKDFANKRDRKEQEWVESILQYSKTDEDLRKETYEGKPTRRTKSPKVNITAHKVNMARARMLDIQLPAGGDFNFQLDPVPDPILESLVGDEVPMAQDPNITRGQAAEAGLLEALDKAKRMQLKVQDQLVQSDYGRLVREAIRDWVLLGTCVIKGPVLHNVAKKRYINHQDSEGGMQSERVVEYSPEPRVERVDPKFFYPDPECLVPEELERAFEVRPVTRTELIKYGDNESFMKDRIRDVLSKDPDGQTDANVFTLNGLIDKDHSIKNKYILKIYNGPLDKNVLRMMEMITEEEVEDPFVEMFGEVWFVQGHIIRVSVSPLDADDSLPYHIVVWEKDDTSLFGHGMPYKMKDQAKVTNAAWRMLLDNSGLSAGPQLALNKEMIKPANGVWDMEPFKIWFMTEYGANVRDAIQFVDVPNNQQSLANVMEMAMQFADLESDTPMIAQNMMPQANNASGMGLILTEANVTQRELSMAWDKYITVPLIERYVDYNMQYSSDPSIKGNFEVHVGAATQRIDNQIIAQDIERILGMASQNEMYQIHIDPEVAFRKWATASRVGPEILRPIEEVRNEIAQMEQQASEAPPDPDQIRAQAMMMQEETRRAQMEAELQMSQAEFQERQQNFQFEREVKIAELEQKDREVQGRLLEKATDREMLLIKLAQENNKTIAQITKEIDIASMSNETSRINKAIDLEKFREEVRVKEQYGTGI